MLRRANFFILSIVVGILIGLFITLGEIYPGEDSRPDQPHVTLYVDRNFSEAEVDIIVGAALEWSKATNHTVEYSIVLLPTKEKPDLKNAVFITKRSVDDPRIILMDLIGDTQTLGIFEKRGVKYIALVTARLNEDNYKSVVLHELGHSLGLKHLEGNANINTLMYPYMSIIMEDGTIIPAGSDHITKKDLAQFCKLYRCNPPVTKPE